MPPSHLANAVFPQGLREAGCVKHRHTLGGAPSGLAVRIGEPRDLEHIPFRWNRDVPQELSFGARTSNRPVVSPRSRTLRQPWHHPPLEASVRWCREARHYGAPRPAASTNRAGALQRPLQSRLINTMYVDRHAVDDRVRRDSTEVADGWQRQTAGRQQFTLSCPLGMRAAAARAPAARVDPMCAARMPVGRGRAAACVAARSKRWLANLGPMHTPQSRTCATGHLFFTCIFRQRVGSWPSRERVRNTRRSRGRTRRDTCYSPVSSGDATVAAGAGFASKFQLFLHRRQWRRRWLRCRRVGCSKLAARVRGFVEPQFLFIL